MVGSLLLTPLAILSCDPTAQALLLSPSDTRGVDQDLVSTIRANRRQLEDTPTRLFEA